MRTLNTVDRYPLYRIDVNRNCIIGPDGKLVNPYLFKNEKWVKLINKNGTRSTVHYGRLLLSCTQPVDRADWLTVGFLNGDRLDTRVENLYWDDVAYTPDPEYLNMPDDALVELRDFPGYRISKLGTVVSDISGTEVFVHRDHEDRPYVNLRNTHSFMCRIYIHRLLALTFLPHPVDVYQLHVNHIDACKTNNALSNLEWVTPRENSLHAVENGLIRTRPVQLMNCETSTVLDFPSVKKAADFLGVFEGHLNNYLVAKRVKKFIPIHGYIGRYRDDPEDWNIVQRNKDFYKRDRIGMVSKCLSTHEVVEHESLTKAATYLGIPASGIRDRLHSDIMVPYRDHLFAVMDPSVSEINWPEYPEEIVQCFNKMKNSLSSPMAVYDTLSGTTSYHPTIREWAETVGFVDFRYLHRVLKMNNNRFKQWVFESVDLRSFAHIES